MPPSRISRLGRALKDGLSHAQARKPGLRLGAICVCSPTHRCGLAHSSRREHSTSSINASEISHFNALAASWWDPHGSSRILHLMNPTRHEFIRGCLQYSRARHEPTSATQRYLDIGCGGGIFAESAARLPATKSVLGLDASPMVIDIAKKHARKDPMLISSGKLTYQDGGIESLPSPESAKDQFDVVTVFEVVEHVDNPSNFLESCLSHVKPGGWIILSTISRTWMSWLTTKVVAEDIMRVIPRGTHDWNKYIKLSELSEWFNKQPGWADQRVMGVVYVPGVGWKEVQGSEEWGNYFFAARRQTG